MPSVSFEGNDPFSSAGVKIFPDLPAAGGGGGNDKGGVLRHGRRRGHFWCVHR